METILRMFQDTAERRGDEACFRFKKGAIWRSLSWTEAMGKIQHFGESLKSLGLAAGDRVAILSATRYEWTLFDMAILSLGGVTVPIYHSTLSEEIKYILNDSNTRVLIAEDSTQLEKILRAKASLPQLEKIVLIEGKVLGDNILSLDEFLKLGEGVTSDFDVRIRKIPLENLASLVYTSGTTGPPKGVMISHRNISAEILAVRHASPVTEEDVSLFFLPLAHILARVIQFFQLAIGFTHAYAESIDKLVDNIQEVRPHFMVSVPRIFEKIHTNMMHGIANAPALKQNIFHWAREVGAQRCQLLLRHEAVPLGLKLKYALAQQLVFSKLHKKLGGRIRFFISGGAPLSREIAEFFYGAGLMILEGYGLTETTAAVNINTPDDLCFGTVGKPLQGIEEKIAPDGEILVRGPVVTQGYWNNPQATTEAIDQDGWFHTGDIGEFDPERRLKITDRKKDLIVTAAGKNVAPQNIENLLKTDPLISQVVVQGDRRKYLTALVTLNPDQVKAKAQEMGLSYKKISELVQSPQIFEMVKKIIDEKNQSLPKYETIKRFAILDRDFSIDGGELTPTLKVKRKLVSERYKDLVDKLYSE